MRRTVWYFAVFCAAASAWAQGPSISNLEPRALVPGQKNILRVHGNRLDAGVRLWWSGGGAIRRLEEAPEGQAAFEIEIPAALPPGVEYLQLASPQGLSNVEFIAVDPLPTQPTRAPGRSVTNATAIDLPGAWEAALKNEEVDYFSFNARAGESIPIEVVAHRLGSPMDPVVRILDAAGRELTLGEDGAGGTRDTQMEFRSPADGRYILAVHDVGYGGGSNFKYRLRVGASFLPGFPWRQGSVVGAAPHSETASLPFEFVSNLGETNSIRFRIASGRKAVFRSWTRSIGSPCDLVLRITDTNGLTVAESDPTRPNDAALTNTFSSAGEYILVIIGLTGRERDGRFRIAAAEFIPGFELTTESSRIEVAPGGTAKLKLAIARFDYAGPIDLDLSGLGEGFSAESTEIPAGKKEWELQLTASADWPGPAFLRTRLVGRSRDGTFSTPLSVRPSLRKSYPLMLNFHEDLEATFGLAITSRAAP